MSTTAQDLFREHFHGCPKCPKSKGPDNIYNAGKSHRGACHTHRTAWLLGSNLFSSWRDETEEQQRERYTEIEGYEDLTPPRVHWPVSNPDLADSPF